mgnify:CR=1 FL=1
MDNRLTIGAELKKARCARNISIDDLANELCISKRYVAALEADQYDSLPEGPFALGFLRSLCDYLKLDTELMVDRLKARMSPQKAASESVMVAEPQTEKTGFFNRLFLSGLAVLISVGYVFSAVDFSATQKQVKTPEVPQHIASMAMVPSAEKIASIINNGVGGNHLQAVQLDLPMMEIIAKDDAWVLIKDDKDRVLVDKVLQAGEKLIAPKERYLKLTSSNANALKLLRDGVDVAFKPSTNFIVSYDLSAVSTNSVN